MGENDYFRFVIFKILFISLQETEGMQNREQRGGAKTARITESWWNVSRFYLSSYAEMQNLSWNSLKKGFHSSSVLWSGNILFGNKLFMFSIQMHMCVEDCDGLALSSKRVDALHTRARLVDDDDRLRRW